jgi:hypothetical protein
MRTMLDLTALLIREGHLAVAPGLSPPMIPVRDNHDRLIDLMRANVLVDSPALPAPATVQSAITRSKRWIGRSETARAVREEVDRLWADKTNFQRWNDWSAANAWLGYAQRSGALFDDIYIPYVAKVLDISPRDALALHARSRDSSEVSRIVSAHGDDFEQMTRAYVACTIIRGRYHEELGKLLSNQILRHPVRGIVSKAPTGVPTAKIDVSPVAWSVACLVLYGAMKQGTLEARFHTWIANIQKLRALLATGGVQLAEGTGHAVVNTAYSLARRADVQIVSARLDTFLRIVTDLGVGVLTSYWLSPWIGPAAGPVIGIAAGTITEHGLNKVGFPGRVRNAVAFLTRETMLKNFAAGRIETEWRRN